MPPEKSATPLQRAAAFCERYSLAVPILLAPMAGACPPALSAAVAGAGGMGACGALLMSPQAIARWAADLRATSNGAFQMNLWIPDAPPRRDREAEAKMRAFLSQWGPAVDAGDGDGGPPDFDAQCDAMLKAGPAVISSIMGVYPPAFVAEMKARGIAWFATVTTVAEAVEAAAAGADAVVAQGAEAGGHRGAFEPGDAARQAVGLFALLPAIVDAVDVPVIAAGGIADSRTIAAALTLGASAVQIGTGFLRCPEAGIPAAWADALAETRPEQTVLTRGFSGRTGRSIATDYVRALEADDAPAPAPYPVQRGLTAKMRAQAASEGDLQRMQAWAGQSARLAQASPAAELVTGLWEGAESMLAR